MAEFFDEARDSVMIDTLSFAQHGKVYAVAFCETNKCLDVLRQAETAKPKAGTKKVRPDSRIQADAVHDFFDIRAEFFRQIGNHIGVGNLQREERIRSMLNQLRAIDCGDHPSGSFHRGARAVMY